MSSYKKVLIISPYFPPSNAADMQRVRMSLPYFKEFGWEAEVVTIDPEFSDLVKDPFLLESIPPLVKLHYVKAFSKEWTSKVGLGSIALRSLLFYFKKVNTLLTASKFDLIYFSTTQFPVCILGAYWKKRYNIPYIIDMQDPWHSTYYQDKPRSERPTKHWFSYRLNKYLEPIAMKHTDGIISVSGAYIGSLKARYTRITEIPCKVITFGYFEKDFNIANKNQFKINLPYKKQSNTLHVIYIGRGGFDMKPAVKLLLTAFKELLAENYSLINVIRFDFIGTSYAPNGKGIPSFLDVAEELNLLEYVKEKPDRVSYYENIKGLQHADALIIPGSNDSSYTASKLYPYILSRKPLLGIFQASSSAFDIIKKHNAGVVADLNDYKEAVHTIKKFLTDIVNRNIKNTTKWNQFEKYSAKRMTEDQCELFNSVVC